MRQTVFSSIQILGMCYLTKYLEVGFVHFVVKRLSLNGYRCHLPDCEIHRREQFSERFCYPQEDGIGHSLKKKPTRWLKIGVFELKTTIHGLI